MMITRVQLGRVVLLVGLIGAGLGCEMCAVAPVAGRATTSATTTSRAVTEVEGAKPGRAGALMVEDITGEETSFKMAYVPGGTFWMGSPDDEPGRQANEGPRHQVRIEPFWMGQYEVKASLVLVWLDEWRQAIREQGIRLSPAAMRAATEVPCSNPYCPFTNEKVRDGAVVTMTAYGAQEFCRWLTLRTGRYYRLPTEVEWEYACRAGTEAAYSFGADGGKLAEYAWFGGRTGDLLRGETRANPWGLYNMYGNVGEYVLDGWSEDYKEEAAAASSRPATPGAWRRHSDRDYAIVRGGDYRSAPAGLRSAARKRMLQSQDLNNNGPMFSCMRGDGDFEATGFRVVRPLRREGDWRERCIAAPEYK